MRPGDATLDPNRAAGWRADGGRERITGCACDIVFLNQARAREVRLRISF